MKKYIDAYYFWWVILSVVLGIFMLAGLINFINGDSELIIVAVIFGVGFLCGEHPFLDRYTG